MPEKIETPLQVGKRVMIRTVTHYHVGDVVDIQRQPDRKVTHALLYPAVWVADTGRFHDALAKGTLREYEPFVYPALVNLDSMVDTTLWPYDLPKEPK